MALFLAHEHAANPPETWEVKRITGRCWHLVTADGGTLDSFPRRKDAEAAKIGGFLVDLYEKERRWYAGEPVAGWRPYSDFSVTT